MRYTVVLEPSAERDLAEVWMRSRLKHAINQAVDRIDSELSSRPQDCGESREHDRRAFYVWPLGVSYIIQEDDRLVRIISVWQT